MDAQVQKKGFAEKPEELVHAAEEFERDGYAPSGSPVKMIPSPFGSPVKKILNDDEKVPDLTNPASAYVAADATADGHVWGPCEVLVLAGPPCGQGCNRAQCSNRLNSKALHGPASIAGGPPWAVGLDVAAAPKPTDPGTGPSWNASRARGCRAQFLPEAGTGVRRPARMAQPLPALVGYGWC